MVTLKRIIMAVALLTGSSFPVLAGPTSPPAGNYITNVSTTANVQIFNVSSGTVKNLIISGTCTGPGCGSGGGGGGTVSASAQHNVAFYTLSGSTTTVGGSSNFTSDGSSVTVSTMVVNGPLTVAGTATVSKTGFTQLIINGLSSTPPFAGVSFQATNSEFGHLRQENANLLCSDLSTVCMTNPLQFGPSAGTYNFGIDTNGKLSVGSTTGSQSTATVWGNLLVGSGYPTITNAPTNGLRVKGAVLLDSSMTVAGSGGLGVTYGAVLGSATLSNVASGTQCLHADSSGHVTGTGSDCGSGGGGSTSGTITASPQFNVGYYTNSGSTTTIGGSSNFTTDGSSVTVSTAVVGKVFTPLVSNAPNSLWNLELYNGILTHNALSVVDSYINGTVLIFGGSSTVQPSIENVNGMSNGIGANNTAASAIQIGEYNSVLNATIGASVLSSTTSKYAFSVGTYPSPYNLLYVSTSGLTNIVGSSGLSVPYGVNVGSITGAGLGACSGASNAVTYFSSGTFGCNTITGGGIGSGLTYSSFTATAPITYNGSGNYGLSQTIGQNETFSGSSITVTGIGGVNISSANEQLVTLTNYLGGLNLSNGYFSNIRIVPYFNDDYYENMVSSGNVFFTGNLGSTLTGSYNFLTSSGVFVGSSSIDPNGAFNVSSSSAGQVGFTEASSTTVSNIGSGVDALWADSATHSWMVNENNDSANYRLVKSSGTPTAGHVAAWSATGKLIDGGTGGGGGGTPAGPNTSVQFNNNGSFGGSSNFEWFGSSAEVIGTFVSSGPLIIPHVGNITFLNATGGNGPQLFNSSSSGGNDLEVTALGGIGLGLNNIFYASGGPIVSISTPGFGVYGSSADTTSTYTGFKAAKTVEKSLLWNLPSKDGPIGAAWVTDGGANLSFTPNVSFSTITAASTSTVVVYSTAATASFRIDNTVPSSGDFMLTVSSVPTNATVPSTQQLMTVDTFGNMNLLGQALATLKTTTPARTGEIVYCSDCATTPVCVSTGTAAAYQYSSISSKSTSCN